MRRFFIIRLWLLAACLLLPGNAFSAESAEPAPSPAPESTAAKALAAALIAAPDDAARDKLLADAPPDLANSEKLRREFSAQNGPVIYSGAYDRAQTLVQYVRRLCKQHGDKFGVALAEWSLANIEGSRGDNHAALARFQACRPIFEELGDKHRLGGVLGGAAIVHLQLGEYRMALECARRSEQLFREIDYKEGILTALNTQGSISMDQGMHNLALDRWQGALTLAGDDEGWQIFLLHNIATVYNRRGETAKCAELLERSAALAEKLDDKPRLALDLQEIANLRWDAGRFEDAEKLFRRALDIAEANGDKRRLTALFSALSGLLWDRSVKQGKPAAAESLALLDHALVLARETGEPAYLWKANTLLGRIRFATGDLAGARVAYEESVAAIEDARGNLTGDDSSTSAFFEDKVEPYTGLVAVLLREKRPLDALVMAERAKARALLDMLAGSKANTGEETITKEEHARLAQLGGEVAAINRQIAAAHTAKPPADAAALGKLAADLAAARSARDSAEQATFAAHPELRNRQALRVADLSSEALRALLGDDQGTALLEYVSTPDETFLFVVTPGAGPQNAVPTVAGFALPVGHKTLAEGVNGFRQALADRSLGWQQTAQTLGDTLLAPVRADCANIQRLVIVPDGPLWELPFQALAANAHEDGTPLRTLWEAWPVSFAPSLTFLAQDRKLAVSGLSAGKKMRVLACGNPSLSNGADAAAVADKTEGRLMDSEYVPLPDAERQVRMIASLYGEEQSTVLVGADAHERDFKRIAGDFDIIHFATHGTFNDASPMYSRLLMSQADLRADEDGLLEAWEWLGLKLHARLAVLSACETGRGKIGAGEGVLGTSWALFGAGCPAVVVSQWKVDSASNTEMMAGFHRRLLAGEEPAEALRGAGLELAKNPKYRHPFYWAPFVFLGAGEPLTAAVARK